MPAPGGLPARVLVTGAAGAIGTAVVEHLVDAGAEVVGFDRTTAARSAASRFIVGDASDDVAVARALEGCDGVVHLAAYPSPDAAGLREVYRANSVATFTVLSLAGERGVLRAAVASSINANGLSFNPSRPLPRCYPLDELESPRISDAYSLSKAVGESAAEMCAARWPMSIVSLRLPHTASGTVLDAIAERNRTDPRAAVSEGWGYLHTADAAEAFLRALGVRPAGHVSCLLSATDTLLPWGTEEALARWAPGVPLRRALPDRTAAIDTALARAELGFAPRRSYYGHAPAADPGRGLDGASPQPRG